MTTCTRPVCGSGLGSMWRYVWMGALPTPPDGRHWRGWWPSTGLWRWTWEQVVYCRQEIGIVAERRRALARLVTKHGWRAVLTGEFPPPGMLIGR